MTCPTCVVSFPRAYAHTHTHTHTHYYYVKFRCIFFLLLILFSDTQHGSGPESHPSIDEHQSLLMTLDLILKVFAVKTDESHCVFPGQIASSFELPPAMSSPDFLLLQIVGSWPHHHWTQPVLPSSCKFLSCHSPHPKIYWGIIWQIQLYILKYKCDGFPYMYIAKYLPQRS